MPPSRAKLRSRARSAFGGLLTVTLSSVLIFQLYFLGRYLSEMGSRGPAHLEHQMDAELPSFVRWALAASGGGGNKNKSSSVVVAGNTTAARNDGGGGEKSDAPAMGVEDHADGPPPTSGENSSIVVATGAASSPRQDGEALPLALRGMLERSLKNLEHCDGLNLPINDFNSTSGADLPAFGIINALRSYPNGTARDESEGDNWHDWNCTAPPPTACHVRKFTVIFMGYLPDRVDKMANQIMIMGRGEWLNIVEEIVLVWNGERDLNHTRDGTKLLEMEGDKNHPLRIFYPLRMGMRNNLLNRYHPSIRPKSEAILYYDDDGPFYSYRAIRAGFELWRRHSDAEMGAMCRNIRLGERQNAVKKDIMGAESARMGEEFVPHCRRHGDDAFYNFYTFPFFDANMALPSGSFLHRNYLCFLWHPVFMEVHNFVLAQPVHPDDITVSMLVSQIGGKAPYCYPRRVHEKKDMSKEKRRLQLDGGGGRNVSLASGEAASMIRPRRRRRKLLWADGKFDWGKMRSEAINSIMGYIGSINSGSIGWCHGSEYHVKSRKGSDECKPPFPPENLLPFMNEGGHGFDTCS